ncbi:hypothetical protein GLOIN_2v1569819 [Rhizophagus irregularis DAOM 181602=DAOM 197198]|uniref:Wax synthase domain-containing protein n=2 Tax=Rhizophagus irregularis TaxID=588596 RepID=A0A2P4QBK8_RHIID|nr:hypothetical protein GLOIN_2v1569819 [Rhizophagus irregularis DAOM 181602=DAOM 197198]POG75024.1 hypothetical protein GLOIN_2v1569819 [Rhizophagus irregularis DAOM 181602=DAOM 197198]|eukprot:XP_025181890.1 hypothetical protein GLOIN_2v1569819 [Rhizophagus irregularis DAOM 181602=DAOM 197198]
MSTYNFFCFLLPITIFSIFSFSPPNSIFRKSILILSNLSLFSFPLIFSNRYAATFQIPIALFSFIYSCKMLIWLKKSLNDPSYIKPFVWSLFYWRAKEGNIPIMRQDDLLKQGITKDRLESYINRHYIIYLCVWILYMICAQFSELFVPDIPKTSFPIRVIEYFFYDGPPFTSLFNLFYCYIYAGALFFSINYLYEVIILSSAHLLKYIYSTPNSFLHRTLTNDQLNSLKLWLISLLFYSKPIFNQPYLSENPRELWSIRWHQMFHEIFVELGYKPACYLFSSFPAKLQKIFGTLASFAISGILHEYILYSSSRYLTLEQFTYFLFNAIVMMIWESFSKFRLDQGQKFLWKRIRDSLFMTVFVLFTLPWFIEPYIKCEHYHSLMHFICRKI